MELAELASMYEAKRSQGGQTRHGWRKREKTVSAETMQQHTICLRALRYWFGDRRDVESIGPMEVEEWLDAILAGKLAHLRQWTRGDEAPTESRVRTYISQAKAICNWAVRRGLIEHNPFDDFSGQVTRTAPKQYVSEADFAKLIEHASNHSLAVLWWLCRYGGLRVGEAAEMRWSGRATDRDGNDCRMGIDWERRTIDVLPSKTGIWRVLPIRPELYDVLLAHFERAGPGAQRICDVATSPSTLRKRLHGTCRRAGLPEWPKPHQCLRASAETDFLRLGASPATVARWMGHHESVARRFYSTTDDLEIRAIAGVT